MANEDLGKAVLTIRTDTSQFDASLNSVAKRADSLRGSFKQTGDAAKGLGHDITGLQGSLSGLVGSLVKGVAGGELLKDGIESVGHAMLGALEAVPHLVEQTLALGASLLTTSLKTGISVEGLSRLRFVAAQTGTDLGGLTSAIFKMEANLGSGTDKVSAALKHLGLSMEDLKHSSPDEAFIQILEKLNQMPGAAERASAGVTIFGKGFREIAQLAQVDIKGLIEEAEKLGIVMTTDMAASAKAAEDAMNAFKFQIEATENRIGGAFLPAVIGLTSDLSVGMKAAIESVNSGLGQMGGSGGFLANVVTAMGTGSGAIAAQTQLYYTLRDAVISFVRSGIEPLVSTFGHVMVVMDELKILALGAVEGIQAITYVIEGLGIAAIRTVQAMNPQMWFGPMAVSANNFVAQLEKDRDRLYNSMATVTASIAQAQQAQLDWGERSIAINKAIEAGLAKVKDGHVDVAAIIKQVAALSRAAAGDMGSAFEDLTDEEKKATKAAELLREGVEAVRSSIRKLDDDVGKLQDATDALQFADEFKSAAEQIHSVDSIISDLTTSSDELQSSLSDIFSISGHIAEHFSLPAENIVSPLAEAFGRVPQLLQQAFTGGGGLKGAASGIGSMFGSTMMSSIFGKAGDGAKKMLSGMTGMMGNILSTALPAIGALIGPAIEGLMKLFGDHAGKDIKKTGKRWGADLSDGLVDQIKSDSKKFGGEVQGMFLNLDKIIAEAGGVTAFGVDKAMSKLHDVFTLVGTHQLTVAQGTKILDANFAEISKAGTDSYGRIGAKLKELIALDDQFKTHSKAVADFLKTQGGNALSGFAGVVGSATPYADLKTKVTDAQKAVADLVADGKQGSADWKTANDALTAALSEMGKASGNAKQELDDLGIQAVASFSAAVAAGVPWNEALTQIGPSLKTLKDDYAALGLGVEDVALKTLLTQSAMATAAPELMAGVAGLSQEFIALDNLSALTPETFAAMERTGERMFTRLQTEAQKAGGDAKDALLPMQAYLHQAEDAAKKYGFAIDEGTQALIDQSKEQGIWKEEGESANDIMIEGFSAIITALGGEIPKAWQHMADEAKKAADKAAQAAEDEAARAQAALDSVTPPDLTGHYSYDFDGFNGGPSAEPSARGSFVRPWGLQYLASGGLAAMLAASMFIPRGTDRVPAMLTPGEGVINTLGMSNLGVAGLRAYNRGEIPASGDSNTSRMEAQLAAVQQELLEQTNELAGIRAAVLATKQTSVQVDGRELAEANTRVLENGGSLLTRTRQALGVA